MVKNDENFDEPLDIEVAFAWGLEFPEKLLESLNLKIENHHKNVWL